MSTCGRSLSSILTSDIINVKFKIILLLNLLKLGYNRLFDVIKISKYGGIRFWMVMSLHILE